MGKESELKKQYSLMLMSYSYLYQLKEKNNLNITLSECNNQYDKTFMKVYNWLEGNKSKFAIPKIQKYTEMMMKKMYNKYYKTNSTPSEDLANIGIFFFYLLVEISKHIKKEYKLPVDVLELKEFLDWYNKDEPLDKDSIIFMYRAFISVYPNKKGLIALKGALGKLYCKIDFKEIEGEYNEML